MTCDERLEALLNRAGQTISDLPLEYSYDQMKSADKAMATCLNSGDLIRNEPEDYLWYILHLTDIIDRMETALENVCGERDYIWQE